MQTLKEMRQAMHLTQAEVAQKIGIVPSLVRMWEAGKRSPLTHADKLAAIYGVEIKDIFLTVNNTKSEA